MQDLPPHKTCILMYLQARSRDVGRHIAAWTCAWVADKAAGQQLDTCIQPAKRAATTSVLLPLQHSQVMVVSAD